MGALGILGGKRPGLPTFLFLLRSWCSELHCFVDLVGGISYLNCCVVRIHHPYQCGTDWTFERPHFFAECSNSRRCSSKTSGGIKRINYDRFKDSGGVCLRHVLCFCEPIADQNLWEPVQPKGFGLHGSPQGVFLFVPPPPPFFLFFSFGCCFLGGSYDLWLPFQRPGNRGSLNKRPSHLTPGAVLCCPTAAAFFEGLKQGLGQEPSDQSAWLQVAVVVHTVLGSHFGWDW